VPKRIAFISAFGLLIAACGSAGQPSNNAAHAADPANGYSQGLKFAQCMRSHGVPNFPDPRASGGGFRVQVGPGTGLNPQSPAFQSAQTSCKHLLPGGGPGSGAPSAQAHAQLLQISECMRQHGVSSFPDPQSGSPPSDPTGYSAIIGRGGYFLAIPSSIDINSPAFKQAATACRFGGPGAKAAPAGS
jgi:hypothetical protein